MNSVLIIILTSLIEIIFTVFLFEFSRKKEYASKLGPIKWQIIVGIIYGIIAICGTEFGIDYDGFIVHIRDAAPLIAGLYFGPISGILAGLIGGVERWFAFYWGAGEFTRLACTIGTIFAGLFAAFIKKFILEDKYPSVVYSFFIGIIAEVLHLLLVFNTNSNEIAKALTVVTTVAPIMITGVAITTAGLAIFESIRSYKGKLFIKHTITDDIQRMLLISVLVAFMITNAYTIIVQNNLAMTTADNTIKQSLIDAGNDAKESGLEGDDLIDYVGKQIANWHIGSTGFFIAFNASADKVYTSTDSSIEKIAYTEAPVYKKNLSEYYEQEKTYYMDKKYSPSGEFDCYFAYTVVKDCYILAVYPGSEANIAKNYSEIITAFMEILILAFLFLQIYFLIKKIVIKNIRKINESLSQISSGNLDTVIDVRSNEEFTSLSDDINSTVGTLKHYIDEAKERIDKELEFAREIQASALPTVFPKTNNVDLYADMIPAKVVGGDFYDFYKFGNNMAAILVADVSGKGIPAALFMMNAKALIKGLVETGASPAETFTKANDELCASNATGLFITAWLGIIDLSTGILRYCNAGHNPPIIAKNNGEIQFLKKRHGLVLAAMDGIVYSEDSILFSKGDGMFLYTDGVTEAEDSEHNLYGEERLLNIVDRTNAVNMRYLCKTVKADIDEFVGEAPQFDDITMLAFKMKDEEDISSYIELKPVMESMDVLTQFIEKFCEDHNVSNKLKRKMLIISDELYSNIVRYSGASASSVTIQERKGMVSISFEDDGVLYNPLDKEDPDVTLSAEEREIGGLGVFMVKKMATDIKYSRINANNVLDIILE